MGLSNQERLKGVFTSLVEMSELQFKFIGKYLEIYKKINALIKKLWPSFLDSKGNSSYWLMGGALDDTFIENELLGIVFLDVIKGINQYQDKTRTKNVVGEYMAECRPNAITLLNKENFNYGNIYSLFKLTEKFFYYSNRYSDSFQRSLRKTRSLVARIQAICLEFFAKNDIFLSAYLSEVIFYKVLGYEEDLVNKWFADNYLHHNCTIVESVSELLKLYKEVNTKQLSLQRRIEIIFKFLDGTYHYDDDHKKLQNLIANHNTNSKVNFINMNCIIKLCNGQKRKRKKKIIEAKEDTRRYCYLLNEYLD